MLAGVCLKMFILFPQSVSQLPYGKALYTYEGKEPGDLKFNKGDIIILRRKVDENWYHGELNGNHGFFPASYIQCIKPLPQAPPQGKALYDFEIKDKDQDKDCLTFTKVGEWVLKNVQKAGSVGSDGALVVLAAESGAQGCWDWWDTFLVFLACLAHPALCEIA